MQNVYSVTQVNSYIKNMFSQDFMLGNVFICGEVSNVTYHSKGHIYFTLKDEKAAISCVMYASQAISLKFRIKEGQQVVAGGSVTVYEVAGKYQLIARSIKLDGQGDLAAEFERLKLKLEEMGMFAPEYKRSIPYYVKKIGVVTAPTGAAIRDIINITRRRNPYVEIILYPSLVQGAEAPKSIINGIKMLETMDIDVMIVGRGGGSMEDLWAFNDEEVAEAIFNCSKPVISAVGHEIDFTIADFVSDLRAPTPSAAAELAVREYSEITDRIYEYRNKLNRQMLYSLEHRKNRLDNLTLRIKSMSPRSELERERVTSKELQNRLSKGITSKITDRKHMLSVYVEKLKGVSPLEKLSQGYAHVSDSQGNTIYDVNKVSAGDELKVFVKNGCITALVKEIDRSDS